MSADSMVQLVSYLAAQQPYEIVGTPESEWVDFKSVPPEGPYDLSTDKGKFDLAKDVAAFSNAGGGRLVCGFKAKKKQTELYEVAEKLTPFDKKVVDSTKYKDVITEYVRPLGTRSDPPPSTAPPQKRYPNSSLSINHPASERHPKAPRNGIPQQVHSQQQPGPPFQGPMVASMKPTEPSCCGSRVSRSPAKTANWCHQSAI
ncbi:hypothetical protein ABZ626_37855 [Streptomyces longispororuber]|uniref:AlbA family DNA-binding domain-containing protein n=1 Tax=Streptomyces longispororuber TaxID=68230 RepID=UPI00340721C0